MGFGLEAGVGMDGEMFSGEKVGEEEVDEDDGVTSGMSDGWTG